MYSKGLMLELQSEPCVSFQQRDKNGRLVEARRHVTTAWRTAMAATSRSQSNRYYKVLAF